MVGRALCKTPTQNFGVTSVVTCKRCLHIMNNIVRMTEDESQSDPPSPIYPELNKGTRITNLETPAGYGDKYQAIEDDRSKVYGDPFLSHQAIGLAWEGVFRNRYHEFAKVLNLDAIVNEDSPLLKPGQMFPSDLVAEMLAAFKVVRLARPIFRQDSVDDGIVYLKFSEKFRKK